MIYMYGFLGVFGGAIGTWIGLGLYKLVGRLEAVGRDGKVWIRLISKSGKVKELPAEDVRIGLGRAQQFYVLEKAGRTEGGG